MPNSAPFSSIYTASLTSHHGEADPALTLAVPRAA
jgi:hypothetical protein